MRTRRREHERDRQARREADRSERRSSEGTVADPPRTVDDLLDVLAEGRGLTYGEAALVGGVEETTGALEADDGGSRTTGGW